MKTTVIVQARMTSTRLPRKVFLPLADKPVLWHVWKRLQASEKIEQIVIATSTDASDDPIVEFCEDNEILCFRGSLHDVLARFHGAAARYDADPIVRVTSDCPVVDPRIVDEVIQGYFEGSYHSYILGGEFPDGLDCSVFSRELLDKAFLEAVLPSEREHVEPYMKTLGDSYKLGCYEKFSGLGHHRWTLDEERDYQLLSALYSELYRPNEIFSTQQILDLLDSREDILRLNQGIVRNEGLLKSLKEDEAFVESKDPLRED